MMRFDRPVLIGLFVALGIAWLMLTASGHSQDKPAPRPAWEYQVLSEPELTKAGGLPKVGSDGWELEIVNTLLRR